MYDREIVMDSLQKISKAIETILERATVVTDPNDLLCSPGRITSPSMCFTAKARFVALFSCSCMLTLPSRLRISELW